MPESVQGQVKITDHVRMLLIPDEQIVDGRPHISSAVFMKALFSLDRGLNSFPLRDGTLAPGVIPCSRAAGVAACAIWVREARERDEA